MEKTRLPKLIFFSHYPRDHHQSPCASVYQVFIGDNRKADLHGHVLVTQEDRCFETEWKERIEGSDGYLFNGFQSLLNSNSLKVLEHAAIEAVPVYIYWHETAWNLRFLAGRSPNEFSQLYELMLSLSATHWVPTSQNMHAVATMFGVPFEAFRIVYEVVDLIRFSPGEKSRGEEKQPIIISGAGVPDVRKGIDRFCEITNRIENAVPGKAEFRWYAATPNRSRPNIVPSTEHVRWMGHREDFDSQLHEIDLFLLTSRDDPSPLVVFEALACNKPVLCFSSTGFSEILPRSLVVHSQEEMFQKIMIFIEKGFQSNIDYRGIAEQYDATRFLERAFEHQEPQVNVPDLNFNLALSVFSDELKEARAHLNKKLRETTRKANAIRFIEHQLEASKSSIQKQLKASRVSEESLRQVIKKCYIDQKLRYRKAFMNSYPFLPLNNHDKTVSTVAVVGNSPILMDTNQGHLIDKCDFVIRVNNFVIEGHETDVGHRTDLAVVSPSVRPAKELERLGARKILVFGANLGTDAKKIEKRMLAGNGCGISPIKENILPSLLYFQRIKLFLALLDDTERWPTTGTVAIQWAVDMFPNAKIFVHGFSFYKENNSSLKRYFGESIKPDGHHDFAAELARFQTMLSRKEIVSFDS